MSSRVILGGCVALAAWAAAGELAQRQWDVFGSFGKVKGEVRSENGGFAYESKDVRVVTTVETDRFGVSLRKTVLKNVSAQEIAARCLLDRFCFEGGEYEVYTQASSWENESRGLWQPLHTGVETRGSLICGSNGAAPILALWNVQAGRGRVFHLLADGAWQMTASRTPGNGGATTTAVAVEVGVDSRHLDYVLKPGEEVALPEVVSYEFTNKTDLDCHRLHAFWNARYPAKRPLPTIYNSWMCRFDKLDAQFVLEQVKKAKALGATYFVIDAGWFGPKADWGSVRGDWAESPDGYLGGRMADVSKAVREAGMKFGFWLEAESASPKSKIVREHPEYFLNLDGVYFLDFTNPAAFNYLLETACALVRKYNAEFMKFDFNQNADYDPTGRAFMAYNAGYRRFVREIRRRNPGIYLQGCASGGLMMNLGWARDFDSFWPSDNESPYQGFRIVKETMLRMPPRLLDRWIVARTVANIQPDYGGKDSRLIACDNGTWTQLRSVWPDYLDAFMTGGPVGFSCDLTAYSPADLGHFAETLANFRQDDAFWRRAVGRLLCDTPSLAAIQYDDLTLDDVRLVVLCDNLRQKSTMLHPVLTPGADYLVDGRRRSSADLAANGVVVKTRIYHGATVRLLKAK